MMLQALGLVSAAEDRALEASRGGDAGWIHQYPTAGGSPLPPPAARVQSECSLPVSWETLLQTWKIQDDSNSTILAAHFAMEDVHGVEVSWVHNPKKSLKGLQASPRPSPPPSSNPRDVRSSPAGQRPSDTANHSSPQPNALKVLDSRTRTSSTGRPTINVVSEPATPPAPSSKPSSRRPSLLRGTSTDKGGDGKPGSRRSTSWISNISNKFSSQTPPTDRSTPSAQQIPQTTPSANGYASADTSRAVTPSGGVEDSEAYTPSRPKESSSSFFSSLTRKLSTGAQTGGVPKVQGKGSLCERRILNRDPNRQRCLVPDMDASKLRKVSFCVDVEIAGGPRYVDEDNDDDDEETRSQKKQDVKMKERAEGQALKRHIAGADDKSDEGDALIEAQSRAGARDVSHKHRENDMRDQEDDASHEGTDPSDNGSIDKKKERKKRSEDERKERKEKRRRRAEENGSVPVELSADGDAAMKMDSDTIPSSLPNVQNRSSATNGISTSMPDPKRDRPTVDPVRIYRRCCQLRESPILKRITEQLMSPTCCVPTEPGVVHCLDLTGSRLQLADMVTLGDWLAVVPVKKLLLEDADVSDEGLRCILAGLLAAKRPEPTRRKSVLPRHREAIKPKHYQERTGKIEKLNLKNNPRVSRNGWKYISLFLYMCRSIKAIDLSMLRFPDTLPLTGPGNAVKGSPATPQRGAQDTDAAETVFKCLSQRLGGSALEELILNECRLSSPQIRKLVDGATVSGVSRLGLAGNRLDDEGLGYVLEYLRSGVCGGLDIGCNDLRGKLGLIADALDPNTKVPFWALSLAGCNLDSDSLNHLFPALRSLPDLRFIDLSHNQDLCGRDNGTISLLRRYIGSMKQLKRLHLADVGMSPKQAIMLADVLPEGPRLAHLSILENPQLTALADAKEESDQEEACALYASLMAAVRVSHTLMCIDIDVPSQHNSEVVKALAKQVVAYSLRNMEQFALEATGSPILTSNAASTLSQAHGGEKRVREISVPDVLMHLVGHVEGYSANHDADAPAPDDDYIVGGTGVVRALQYVLGERTDDQRRPSKPSTPTRARPSSSAGFDAAQRGKAKKMSKNLLESARNIRSRLQPALVKEATGGDEMAYRRLLLLDQTLQSMIQRFEEEYPETRLTPPSPPQSASAASSLTERSAPLSINTSATEVTKGSQSDEDDEYEEDGAIRAAFSRRNSDVSIASRALAIEEGHLHRLGQRLRRDMVDSANSPSGSRPADGDEAPWKEEDERRLKELQVSLEAISGSELKSMVQQNGWETTLQKFGANMQDLRQIQEEDSQSWADFQDAHFKARMNAAQAARDRRGGRQQHQQQE